MSRNKQIEEMTKDVTRSICWCNEEIPTVDGMGTATTLYNKGYRKASEVAEEIFAEIEKIFGVHLWCDSTPWEYQEYEELKKKYTEGEG